MTELARSPFPGMDPYLEHPGYWLDVHHRLITYLGDHLRPKLAPRYYAHLGERVVLEAPRRGLYPDVEVLDRGRRGGGTAVAEAPADPAVVLEYASERHVGYLEIRDAKSGHRLVTLIEILSPSNKEPGSLDRKRYLQKQDEVLRSDVHLIEIDLLRDGERVTPFPEDAIERHHPYHCLITISRAGRGRWVVYPVSIRNRLPRIPVPLVEPDPDVVADLQAVVEQAYEGGSYGMLFDYAKPPIPPLSPEDDAWGRARIGEARRPAKAE